MRWWSAWSSALAARDEATLAALVPDRDPPRAGCRPACAPTPPATRRETAGGEAVSVAAAADRQPWTLTFRRPGGRWRLTAAGPVLQ